MNTLVVTTINPYAKLAYQKQCLEKWKDIGYDVRTYNNKDEKNILLEKGFDSVDIIEISKEETAFDLIGKPIPRVLAILNKASHYHGNNIILVNSDIYPACNNKATLFLSSVSNNIALTRKECLDMTGMQYTGDLITSYQGGLDIFFFTVDVLKKILCRLTGNAVAEMMTFGMPGWDFFLAHIMTSYYNGTVMDSEIFFHKSHTTTYGDVRKEVGLFMGELIKSKMYRSSSANDVLVEFSEKIKNDCKNNSRYSKQLKIACFVRPKDSSISIQDDFIKSTLSSFNELLSKFNIEINYSQKEIKSISYYQFFNSSWEDSLHCYNSILDKECFFNGYCILVLLLICRSDCMDFTSEYPKNSLHNKSVEQIVSNKLDDKTRLMYVMRLFCSELINYSIFNKNLFKYIVLSANTPRSLQLCRAIFLKYYDQGKGNV